MKRKWLPLVLIVVVMLPLLTACVPGDGSSGPNDPAGFFWGIWHGWVAPVSLVIGFFNRNIRIYEIHNTGHWYDVGFYIAMIGGFGGFALTRKKKRDKDD